MNQAITKSAYAALLLGLSLPSLAQGPSSQGPSRNVTVYEEPSGVIVAADATGTYLYADWDEYLISSFFQRNDMRCRPSDPQDTLPGGTYGTQSDCSNTFTNPSNEYAPSAGTYEIPVVVHVIQSKQGNGYISPSQVQSQIDILNEDFQAIGGTNGAGGTDCNIVFYLASTDPDGNATSGITYHKSNSWYNDKGSYASSIGWDTNRYLNIYTNTAGGYLGYAYIPSGGGVVGASNDGVRILWRAFGRDSGYSPYDQGRTATHEVGHYLGLYHTFQGGCASASGCASNGDLICDTNPESSPNYSGCSRATCSSPDPVKNYMDYSEDLCMNNFSANQARRLRCTLANFRVDLWSGDPGNSAPAVSVDAPANGTTVNDGDSITFQGSALDAEDGDLSSTINWSSNLDGSLGTGASVVAVLSVGTHTVTATATDSGSLSGSDSISVTVQSTGGGLTLTETHGKVKGRVVVDLSWSGASGSSVEVYRDGSLLTTTANDGEYRDNTGLKGGGTLTYQVCEPGGACSNTVVVNY